MNLANATYIVTGMNGGIGRLVVDEILNRGARVIGIDLADVAVDELKNRPGLTYIGVDLTNIRSAEELRELLDPYLGGERVGGMVNLVGRNIRNNYMGISLEEWDDVLALNLRTIFLLCQLGSLILADGGGAIVNVSSSAAKMGGKIVGMHYSAAKAGVNTLTVLFAKELAASGVRVNAIAPGPTLTPFHDTTSQEEREMIAKNVPLGHFANPREIALPIIFLLSDAASFITGEIVDVNGGVLMDTV